MKKKKLMSLFAGTLVFSIACSTVVSSPMRVAFAAEREAVESEVKQASKATDSSVEEGVIAANKSIQYLSDMKEERGHLLDTGDRFLKIVLLIKRMKRRTIFGCVITMRR